MITPSDYSFWYFQTVLTLFIADIRHIVCNIVFVFVGQCRQMSYVPRTFKWLTARFSMSDEHNLSDINAFKKIFFSLFHDNNILSFLPFPLAIALSVLTTMTNDTSLRSSSN